MHQFWRSCFSFRILSIEKHFCVSCFIWLHCSLVHSKHGLTIVDLHLSDCQFIWLEHKISISYARVLLQYSYRLRANAAARDCCWLSLTSNEQKRCAVQSDKKNTHTHNGQGKEREKRKKTAWIIGLKIHLLFNERRNENFNWMSRNRNDTIPKRDRQRERERGRKNVSRVAWIIIAPSNAHFVIVESDMNSIESEHTHTRMRYLNNNLFVFFFLFTFSLPYSVRSFISAHLLLFHSRCT